MQLLEDRKPLLSWKYALSEKNIILIPRCIKSMYVIFVSCNDAVYSQFRGRSLDLLFPAFTY